MVVMLQKLRKNHGLRLACCAALIFFLICSTLNLHRYWSFYASFDQGLFNQLFWNSVHGNLFESSLSSSLSTNVVHAQQAPEVFYRHLGQHFNPIFLLWMPIYAVFPHNETLIILQVLFITVAGLVLYALARHYLQPMLAAMITISFYCTATVNAPTLANFHDISAAPLLLFAVLLAMEKQKWWLFLLSAILLLTVRQDVGISLFSIGFYMLLSRRFPRMGLVVCLLSLGYILLVTQFIMPQFSADVARRMTMERFGQFATNGEASTLDIIWSILTNPMRLLGELFRSFPSKIGYIAIHSLALGLVPILSSATWTSAGFPLLYLFLQRARNTLTISIRYAMPVVPGIFYGAIIWWSTRQYLYKQAKIRRFWKTCIILSLLVSIIGNQNSVFYFLIPDSINPLVYISIPQQWNHIHKLQPLLKQIPVNASVSATTEIIPQLSNRREIVRLPELRLINDARQTIRVEYIIADIWRRHKYQVALKGKRQALEDFFTFIDELTNNQQYGIIGFADGVILLKLSTPSNPQATNDWLNFRN
jgi:uncharacterized membrane protein